MNAAFDTNFALLHLIVTSAELNFNSKIKAYLNFPLGEYYFITDMHPLNDRLIDYKTHCGDISFHLTYQMHFEWSHIQ